VHLSREGAKEKKTREKGAKKTALVEHKPGMPGRRPRVVPEAPPEAYAHSVHLADRL
jgi:hypothetical protein